MLSVFLVILTLFLGLYIFKNSESAVDYYMIKSDNENRLTLSSSSNLLDIFVAENGMNDENVKKILEDKNFENTQIFRLVNIPVSAKFGFFDIWLESDIPVFSVTDGVLTGATIPVGMSRVMIDVYNSQFAGSASYFPQMREFFLLGQKIDFSFGKSKIFESTKTTGSPITGTITQISKDFPGIWLILPESIVASELAKIGHSLWNPYKIVTTVKDISKKNEIKELYQKFWITTQFEIDDIEENRDKIRTIGYIVFGICSVIIAIILIFFIFLLSGFFRERKNIFELISLFGLNSKKSYFVNLSEPIFLSSIGIIFGCVFIKIFQNFFHTKLASFLDSHGILFPLVFPNTSEIAMLFLIISIGISLVIFAMEMHARKKYTFSNS